MEVAKILGWFFDPNAKKRSEIKRLHQDFPELPDYEIGLLMQYVDFTTKNLSEAKKAYAKANLKECFIWESREFWIDRCKERN